MHTYISFSVSVSLGFFPLGERLTAVINVEVYATYTLLNDKHNTAWLSLHEQYAK